MWATPVLVALPLWAYLFQGTLEPPPAPEGDPLVLGGQVYASSCSTCHGSGGGGVGGSPALAPVVERWPDFRDQMLWVRVGSAAWPGETRGVSDVPVGVGMPAFGLSDAELAQVVLYTRVEHGGLDAGSDEAADLVAVAEGSVTFAEAGLGDLSAELGFDESELAG